MNGPNGSALALRNPAGGNSSLQYAGGNATEEARLGQIQAAIPDVGRIQAPEDANADMALGSYVTNPGGWMSAALFQVPAVIEVEGEFTVFSTDFNVMANYQYVRAGADDVGAEGRNDQTTYQLLPVGGGSNVYLVGQTGYQPFSAPNLILGFQIEWGVNMLNYQPFTMEVQTFNFRGRSFQPLDRHFTLRMGGAQGFKGGSSGIFQALFAQRLTSSDSCGYVYTANSGMNKAIVQPAIIPNIGAPVGYMPGYAVVAAADMPYIQVKIPIALVGFFGATVHLLSAASPYLAATREAIFMDGQT